MQNIIEFQKNIAKKMVLIAQDMKYVQMTGENKFHGYKYVSATDISRKANESLTKHGVATFVSHDVISIDTVTNQKGNQEKLATVKANVTFVDSESGEMFTSSGLGSGQDSGDKAIMKAQTAALKYVFLQAFNIESGNRAEDPEYDVGVDERMGATPQKGGKSNTSQAPANNVVRMEDKKQATQIDNTGFSGKCSCCGNKISEKVEEFSNRRFGKPICMDCQKSGAGTQKKVSGNPAPAPQHHEAPDYATPFDDGNDEIPF